MTLGLSEAPGIGRLLMENRFSVPNHQRDYSWTEDEVRELLEDVTTAIREQSRVYFVGLMVFLGSDPSRLIVLDGQQRLATAVIVFSAIRNWLRQYDEYREDADDIQRDYIGRRQLGSQDIEPRIILNFANNGAFQQYVVRSSSDAELTSALRSLRKRDRNRRLLEAVLYVRHRINQMAEEFNARPDAADYFFSMANYLRDSVGVVKLIVPAEEMAYTVFETLNDRGLELSPLDLVKNHLFGRAASHSSERIKLLEERWAQMMQILSGVRSDNFLKAFWTSRHGRIRTRKLFDAFKRQYPSASDADVLSAQMLEAAEQYAALDVADDPVWAGYSERARNSVRALKVIGSQQAHPVMLSALARMTPREVERVLWLLEGTIVRYLLVGGGATGRFETRCAVLAGKIYSGDVGSATAALSELKEVYPSDEQFRQNFVLKEEDNNSKAQYLLRKLEIEARRRSKPIAHAELQPAPMTVEHVLPRNPGREWEETTSRDPGLAEECTYRLGNLCLLTDVNRKLGGSAFEEKRAVYRESDLETTKELASYTSWGRREIEARQQAMADLAVSAWRFQ